MFEKFESMSLLCINSMHEIIFESSLKQIPIKKIKGICLIFIICPTSFINKSYWTIVLNPHLTCVDQAFLVNQGCFFYHLVVKTQSKETTKVNGHCSKLHFYMYEKSQTKHNSLEYHNVFGIFSINCKVYILKP